MVLLDNFGILLAGLMRTPTTLVANPKISMVDNTGVSRLFDLYSGGAGFFRSGSTLAQVGDGNTAVTKQDFTVDNAFLNAPENVLVSSALWGITGEKTQTQTSINGVNENGTVREVILAKNGRDTSNVARNIVLARDLTNEFSFIIGENILVEHTLELA